MVGDMISSCPLHISKVLCVMSLSPAIYFPSLTRTVTVGSKNLKAFLYGWLPLSDAAGIIILQFGIPILFHSTMSFLCWALQMPVLDTPGFQIRENGILSNNIRILSPNKRHQNEQKGHSVEKTSIFEVFRNTLADKWLHGLQTINGRFTKYKFAKGIVSLHQRPCFVV